MLWTLPRVKISSPLYLWPVNIFEEFFVIFKVLSLDKCIIVPENCNHAIVLLDFINKAFYELPGFF